MFQRHLAIVLLSLYSLFSLSCLTWKAEHAVRSLKSLFFYLISPVSQPPLEEMDRWGAFGRNTARLIRQDQEFLTLQKQWELHRLDEKRTKELEAENQRLTALLDLPTTPVFRPVPARVIARDPNNWFHSVIIGRGEDARLGVSYPVVALQNGREVLLGQIAEVYAGTAKVLLVTDPLSAVSARLSRTKEEGAIEGQGRHRLVMNYLFSDTDVQRGDEVVTAGLGGVFPEGIFLGTVEAVEEASRESFKRATVKPAVRLGQLREVEVLCPGPAAAASVGAEQKP